jgi:hypothetical protein
MYGIMKKKTEEHMDKNWIARPAGDLRNDCAFA